MTPKKTPARKGRPALPAEDRRIMTAMRLSRECRSGILRLCAYWVTPDGRRPSQAEVVERAINEAQGREICGPGYISPLDPRRKKPS